MQQRMGTRQDFHVEHAVHRPKDALRRETSYLVDVETVLKFKFKSYRRFCSINRIIAA